MNNKSQSPKSKILTIPNVMSLFRLCLIPVIVWLYCMKQNYLLTTLVLLLSGITDIVDGYIARRFNMVSDLGKILDPVADKLTQGVTLLCLSSRFKRMWIPFALLIIAAVLMGITGLLAIRKTQTVMSANWHGKVNTVLLYVMMLIHLICFNIPSAVSDILIAICSIMLVTSLILYGIQNIRILREH